MCREELELQEGHSLYAIGGSRPGQAQVKFWSVVLIAYHHMVLRDDVAE